MTHYKKTLGTVLRVRRMEMGLYVREVVKLAKIKRSSLTDYENGRYYPKDPALSRLAAALELDITYLKRLRDAHKPPEPPEHKPSKSNPFRLCGDCMYWYPDVKRTESPNGGLPVLMGTCEQRCCRVERCDFCTMGLEAAL